MTEPITDLEIETFEFMHKCPNTHPGGGCAKCSMVARIRQLQRQLDDLTAKNAEIMGKSASLEAFLKEARLDFLDS